MVEFNTGVEDIFEDEDLEVTVPDVKVMPTTLSKAMFPDAPDLSSPSAAAIFSAFSHG